MREVITQRAQLGRSSIAATLSLVVAKLATTCELTAPISQELSLVAFAVFTQVGMWARNNTNKTLGYLG